MKDAHRYSTQIEVTQEQMDVAIRNGIIRENWVVKKPKQGLSKRLFILLAKKNYLLKLKSLLNHK